MKLAYRNPKNAVAVAAYWGKSLDKPDWYSINAAAGDEAEIFIYDVIGWPYNDAGELVRMMAGMRDRPVTMRINSPGGDVFDGMSIYNAAANHPGGVTVRIEGLAASMASIVAMAGRKVEAYQNTMVMIHNAWMGVVGDHNFMREMADVIEKISGQMLDVYVGKAKTGKREMKQMMDDETFMTAQEAKEKGLIDTVLANGKGAKALFDLPFSNVPECLRAEGNEPTEREIERALRDVGLSKNKAKKALALLAGCSREPEEAELIEAAKKTLNIFGGK